MGRSPCCSKEGLNRGAWTAMEDKTLTDFIKVHGEGKWRSLPKRAGLKRCGKSCRLRWLNYLRPDIKRGNITDDEADLIIRLHNLLGNRWSLIAGRLPGRTDNEIKNYWHTNISKKLNIKGGGGGGKPRSSSTSTGKCLIRRSSTVKKPLSLRPQPLASDSCAVRTKATRCTRVSIPSEPQADNRTAVGPPLHEDLSVDNRLLVGRDLQLISKEDDSNDFVMDFELDDAFLSEFLKSDADPFCGFENGVNICDAETGTNHETSPSSDVTAFSSDDMLHDLDQLGSMASLLDPDMDWLQN